MSSAICPGRTALGCLAIGPGLCCLPLILVGVVEHDRVVVEVSILAKENTCVKFQERGVLRQGRPVCVTFVDLSDRAVDGFSTAMAFVSSVALEHPTAVFTGDQISPWRAVWAPGRGASFRRPRSIVTPHRNLVGYDSRKRRSSVRQALDAVNGVNTAAPCVTSESSPRASVGWCVLGVSRSATPAPIGGGKTSELVRKRDMYAKVIALITPTRLPVLACLLRQLIQGN